MSHNSNKDGKSDGSEEDQRNTFFTLEAMQNQFKRIETMFLEVKDKFEQQDRNFERQDRLLRTIQAESSGNNGARRRENPPLHNHYHYEEEQDEDGFDEEEWYGGRNNARGGRGDRGRNRGGYRGRAERGREEEETERVDRNIGSIKMKMPPFQGRNDADAYLEWERKVEMIFACHNYSEEKKVKLAAVEFSDYAAVWWDQLMVSRRRTGERPVETWDEMKRIMKKRFVPSYYYRELHQKLQTLRQGTKSVEDYHKEMEIAMIRANIEEDREATMARFLAGLNKEIANVLELHQYLELEDMVSMAMKIEKQLKGKSFSKGNTSGSSNSWGPKWPKKEEKSKDKSYDNKDKSKEKWTASKGAPTSNDQNASTKQRDIKCFKCLGSGHRANQCPNRKIMYLQDGVIESEDSD